MGSPTIEADLRLRAGERLLQAGRQLEGEAELRKAIEFHTRVGATHYVHRAEGALAESQSDSA
jgi:hypothetical protein